MSVKKSTTPRKSAASNQLRRQLARDLAAIIANPETPRFLFNSIVDPLTDIECAATSPEGVKHTHEQIERGLAALTMIDGGTQ